MTITLHDDSIESKTANGFAKYTVAVYGDTRVELEGKEAKDFALQALTAIGVSGVGLSNIEELAAIDAETGQPIDGMDAFDPTKRIAGYRVTFVFSGMP